MSEQRYSMRSRSRRPAVIIVLCLLLASLAPVTHSQSGRQKAPPTPKNGKPNEKTTMAKPESSSKNQDDDDTPEVLRVTSTLVPVPATVFDAHGVALTNLKLEDFELRVDGQPHPINELHRSESPVRMVMLFDNSGSLSDSREFEKHAAIQFFHNVMRPIDQAAIYSVSTDIFLAQTMTSDIGRLRQTIELFGKPEGATSLYDAIFEAVKYLKPYQGRRVIIIVSDGRDTTSRVDHDFDTTLQKLLSEDCQVYVVQTGIYDNANVRDLAAERRMYEFSSQTGGDAFIPKTVSDLDSAFSQIAADLAQQYILSYYPSEEKRDGKFHLLAVRIKTKPNSKVRARRGFVVKLRDRA